MIIFTEKAKQQIVAIIEEHNKQGQGVRVNARRGRSPFSLDYGMHFIEPGDGEADDQTVELDGFRVYMDPESAPFLENATVDFVESPTETGFKIANPDEPKPQVPTGPLAERVRYVIEHQINPGVASHGGYVSLVEVKDDVVYIQLGGGCHGCAMANATLKQGVEVMIKQAVPEVKEVRDATDHAGGENPFYA